MRTYTIDCLQGTGFCDWSHDEPATRAQIIEHFNCLRETEGMEIPKRALTLRFISYAWEVSINKTTKHEAKND
jgi:hypothetical protein